MASKRNGGQAAKPAIADSAKCEDALREFVRAVDVTGGVLRSPIGLHAPVADPGWTDIGDVYVQACAALGHKPAITEAAAAEEEDSDER